MLSLPSASRGFSGTFTSAPSVRAFAAFFTSASVGLETDFPYQMPVLAAIFASSRFFRSASCWPRISPTRLLTFSKRGRWTSGLPDEPSYGRPDPRASARTLARRSRISPTCASTFSKRGLPTDGLPEPSLERLLIFSKAGLRTAGCPCPSSLAPSSSAAFWYAPSI